jgi:uncharacterized protein (TIGR02996 family)
MDTPDLLPALLAQPDDDTDWLVYADWLEERSQPLRAEWVRRVVALGAGGLPIPDLQAALRLFKKQRHLVGPDWADILWRLRAARPMRFRIFDIWCIGDSPPREMLDRALTIVQGALEAGTIRVGQEVLVPLTGGGSRTDRVFALDTRKQADFRAYAVGQVPLTFGLMWPGHRRDLATEGLIVPATVETP